MNDKMLLIILFYFFLENCGGPWGGGSPWARPRGPRGKSGPDGKHIELPEKLT